VRWSDWTRLKEPAAKQAYLWQAMLGASQGGPAGAEAAVGVRRRGAEGSGVGGIGVGVKAGEDPLRVAARWWRIMLDGGGR